VFFINRNIELLTSRGRPLSGGIEVRRALYEKRLPLYRSVCDEEITSDTDTKKYETVEQIIASFLKISERG
jgi:shikimate kinase